MKVTDNVMKSAWSIEHEIALSIAQNRYSMTDTAEAIAKAILAERERCVRIISCGCGDQCGSPSNCAKDDIEAIRSEP